jgi:hypothetical protein
VVDSPLGQKQIDSEGAAISVVRMNVSRAYAGVPGLLQKIINDNEAAAWNEITDKIDYIYDNLDYALTGLDQETGFGAEVKDQIRSGKKLLFKPNLVAPGVIDPVTHGEGLGAPVVTEWPFLAALMRWFHAKLDISYHQMALGEAASATSLLACSYSEATGMDITTEAVPFRTGQITRKSPCTRPSWVVTRVTLTTSKTFRAASWSTSPS